jgi:hypothetical protein
MGTLKPGATYVYERDGSTIYAREIGADPSTRKAIGWDYPYTKDNAEWAKKFLDEFLWTEIMTAAETNPALQEALERVKVIYYLSKDNEK